MKKNNLIKMILVGTLAVTSLAGCGTKATTDEGTTPDYPKNAMEFIAPGGAGGGWDLTIRTVAKVLEDTELVSVPMPITNKPGGGGGITLAYMQEKKDADNLIAVYSPPIILINLNGSTEFSYKDTTPLAGLISDYAAFAVNKGSKYTNINEVMDALKKDPKSVKIGGNSAAGSMDHIQFLIIAKAAGVKDLKQIDFISFQDGGAAAQLLGNHIDLLTTGISDVAQLAEAGEITVLAQSADKRIGTGVVAEIPTCIEEGIDATFTNWRGLFAPKDMPDYAVEYWQDTLGKMVETPEWIAACKTNGWDQKYLNTADFNTFLDKTNEDYKSILEEIGMLK
ncbi:tripartite tricarboxylate transporter substrate binding protein [Clostridium sp.]|uniref:tripartite tricarboxylate transporter substrate binding protein n=1 Tax=Clostridium sp. TaxID=1506 RepID=UPI001A3CD05B|nr:tripartite tricarboxylate transporter substrate-binding protein [Clostridium sp.]MBK5241332.1 tripartite tricarboxylate transporter substrate binding protein [Clostridium sp.]